MSIKVKCFDEATARAELRKCPKIVQDYFKLIERSRDSWEDIAHKAISKLKKEAHEK